MPDITDEIKKEIVDKFLEHSGCSWEDTDIPPNKFFKTGKKVSELEFYQEAYHFFLNEMAMFVKDSVEGKTGA